MAEVTPYLVCTSGSLEGQVFELSDTGLSLGRYPDNDVVIPDDGVSRYHARLLYDNGSLWLRDAGSRNGVFVNDVRLSDHRALKVGDVIRIAQTEFEVRWGIEEVEDSSQVQPEPDKKKRWYWPFS